MNTGKPSTRARPDSAPEIAEPVFEIDRRVRDLFLPYRETAPVKAIGWLSAAGDQAQLRILSSGTLVVGLLRRDHRMAAAGLRMLVAHEAATLAKKFVKGRVVRERPRSSGGKHPAPRTGHDTSKEKSSFPSGHSAGATAVAQAFAAVYPERAGTARTAAAAVALGRLPGCSHYPTDIAAGAAIGAGAAGIVGAVFRFAARMTARRG